MRQLHTAQQTTYLNPTTEHKHIYPVTKLKTLKRKSVPVHTMKACRRNRGPLILNLSTRWKWVVDISALADVPTEKKTGTRWISGWVGPRASVCGFGKRLLPVPGFESRTVCLINELSKYALFSVSVRYGDCCYQNVVASLCTTLTIAMFLHINIYIYIYRRIC